MGREMTQFTQAQLKSVAEYSCARLLAAREGVELFNEPFKHVVIDNFFPMTSRRRASTRFRTLPIRSRSTRTIRTSK
jgi:hypothetical protein